MIKPKYINREISWLSFNERVLQEAEDDSVPLIERLRFLGIYSNNLDDYIRVRVASVKRMIALSERSSEFIGDDSPETVLHQIQEKIAQLEIRFKNAYTNILRKLREHNIFFLNEKNLSEEQGRYVNDYFRDKIRPHLVPVMLDKNNRPEMRDGLLYLMLDITIAKDGKKRYALMEIANRVGRFHRLPSDSEGHYLLFVDDMIRYCLPYLFHPWKIKEAEAYSIRITRDAELDIEDNLTKPFMLQMAEGVKRRGQGDPVQIVYDKSMPPKMLTLLRQVVQAKEHDHFFPSGKHHNLLDLVKIPTLSKKRDLVYKEQPPIYKEFTKKSGIMKRMDKEDFMLFFPYHNFNHYIDFLREAAIDPQVQSIYITIYRAAIESDVMNCLIHAAHNKKEVTVVIEIQARFDESNNIDWTQRLHETEGIKVVHSLRGLKVHAKMTLVQKATPNGSRLYGYIGTGNFNEATSKVYSDIGYFTTRRFITREMLEVFESIYIIFHRYQFKKLIVSPFNQRERLLDLIHREAVFARKGERAEMRIKLNSLTDRELIDKLYWASQQGVKIQLIIRGICSLIPQIEGLSENIECRSIVGRYLEHARLLIFHNGGKKEYFISSADWMDRNLNRRIEVTCPIYPKPLQQKLEEYFEIQWQDNVKARIHDEELTNQYYRNSQNLVSSQDILYQKAVKDKL